MIKRLLLLMGFATACAVGQALPETISDTLKNVDGSNANCTLYITNPTFLDSTGFLRPTNTIQTQIVNGVLSVMLVPTTNAQTNPAPYYSVKYSCLNGPPQSSTQEFWAVPPQSPLTVAQVRVAPFNGNPGLRASNYLQMFTGVTSVVLAHNMNTTAVNVSCYNSAVPPQFIEPNTIQVTDANDVTVTFTSSQSGYCVVGGGNFGAAGGSIVSSFNGRTGAVVPTTADYTYAQIGGATQGNTTKPQMAGTNSGVAGAALCDDSNGNATTSGCTASLPSGTQTQLLHVKPNTGNNTTMEFTSPPFVKADDFNFPAQAPGGSLTSGVSNVITLAPCPLGLNATDGQHYVYLSGGTGTAEAVLITGATCTSGASSGTITVTPAFNHTGPWTVTSASGGIKEAFQFLGNAGTILLAPETYNIYAPLVRSPHVSLQGNGAPVTLLNCAAGVSPCLVVADGSGVANVSIAVDSGFKITGAGSLIWVGGDPNNVFAPSTWQGNNYHTVGVLALGTGTGNALTLWLGDFLDFSSSIFETSTGGTTSGQGLALYIPSGAGTAQPVSFDSGSLLSVPTGNAVQMDSNSFGVGYIQFIGGQVSGTIVGSQLGWESYGTHYESNIANQAIVSLAGSSANITFRATGGLMSVHGTALTSMLSFVSTGIASIYLDGILVQDDVGMTTTNFLSLNDSTSAALTLRNINIAPAGTFTNLFSLAGGTIPYLTIEQPANSFASPSITAAATTAFPTGIQPLNYPISRTVVITGSTVGGSGITAVSGLQPKQSGTLQTQNTQTFTSGATIGNTITTTAGVPYSFYFDGTQIWIH